MWQLTVASVAILSSMLGSAAVAVATEPNGHACVSTNGPTDRIGLLQQKVSIDQEPVSWDLLSYKTEFGSQAAASKLGIPVLAMSEGDEMRVLICKGIPSHGLGSGFSRLFADLGFPLIVMVMVIGIPSMLYWRQIRTYDDHDHALYIVIYCEFQNNLSFIFPLVDSLSLAKAFGGGDSLSGYIVGSYKLASSCGGFIIWIVLRCCPNAWREGRRVILCNLFLQLLGCTICLVVAFATAAMSSAGRPLSTLQTLFLLGRVLQGLGGGLTQTLLFNQIGHLATPEQRPERLLALNLAWALGIGFAPGLAGLAGAMPSCDGGPATEPYQATMLAAMVPPLVSALLLTSYPSLDDAADYQPPSDGSDHNRADKRTGRDHVVVACCLTLVVLRAYGIASLEAALTWLLEVLHGLSALWVGLVTSSVFLSCFIVKYVRDTFKHMLTMAWWLRVMMGIAFAASVLLLPSISSTPSILAAACALIFPTLFMSGGLISGIMQNHCLEADPIINLRTVALLSLIGSDAVGRGLAPSTTRSVLASGGQLAYCLMQTALGAAAILLLEVVFAMARPAVLDPLEVKAIHGSIRPGVKKAGRQKDRSPHPHIAC